MRGETDEFDAFVLGADAAGLAVQGESVAAVPGSDILAAGGDESAWNGGYFDGDGMGEDGKKKRKTE